MSNNTDTITLYTSNYCGHARRVEQFLADENIPVTIINITEDLAARETLIGINNGFASVPTLVFADGSKLTEPSIEELRLKLGLEQPDWREKIRARLNHS